MGPPGGTSGCSLGAPAHSRPGGVLPCIPGTRGTLAIAALAMVFDFGSTIADQPPCPLSSAVRPLCQRRLQQARLLAAVPLAGAPRSLAAAAMVALRGGLFVTVAYLAGVLCGLTLRQGATPGPARQVDRRCSAGPRRTRAAQQ